jgi:pSer/pThr/pTyr-binding forkhead associated (FHA) protein
VIGPDPAAVVWLDSAAVSRCHARIIVDPGGARLEDLGSKNARRCATGASLENVRCATAMSISIRTTRLVYRTAAGSAAHRQWLRPHVKSPCFGCR